MDRLVIYRGEELFAEHELARAVIGLGRHPENDIVLDDRTLSRFHARIEKRADSYVVIDLGAQNGVHKNGARIEKESALNSGDRIELGLYVAVFEAKKKPPPTPKPSSRHADLDLDVNLDDDLAFDPDVDARTDTGREDVRTDNADFEGGASVEYVPPKPTFIVLFNGMEVSRHPLTESGITVGRSKGCEIVISLLGLSRRHARIYASDDGVIVEDLGSQNGTWVNNLRIEGSHVLRHGDLMNFYDYGLLFLEDADVEVGFPGADFKQPPPTDLRNRGLSDDLSARETDQATAPPVGAQRQQPPSTRSPLTDPKDPKELEPSTTAAGATGALSRLDLDDLGEGSFLGEDFENSTSKSPVDRSAQFEGVSQVGDEDLEAEIAFATSAAFSVGSDTNGDIGKLADHTTAGFDVLGIGGIWPTDDDLDQVLAVSHGALSVTLDVTLKGKPYAQIPLSQAITRIGTDARCEIALPRSAVLRPWHCTLLDMGGAVMVQRSNRAAFVEVGGKDVDVALLQNNDVVKIGKVEIKLRFRTS